MLKLLLKGVFFILLSLLITNLLYKYVVKQYWGDQNLHNKITYGAEMINDSETLFIGSSHTKHGINPQYFDMYLGDGKSYNLAEGNVANPESYFIVKDIIEDKAKHPKLKTIYLELSKYKMPKKKWNNMIRMRYFMDWKHSSMAYNSTNLKNVEIGDPQEFKLDLVKKTFENTFKVSMLHSYLINVYDNPETEDSFREKQLGYVNNYDIQAKKENKWVENAPKRERNWLYFKITTNHLQKKKKNIAKKENDLYLLNKLEELNMLAKDKNVNLVVYMMPRLKKQYQKELLPIFNSYSGNKISFNDPMKYPELWDNCANAFDQAHLNQVGSSFLSEYLANYHKAAFIEN